MPVVYLTSQARALRKMLWFPNRRKLLLFFRKDISYPAKACRKQRKESWDPNPKIALEARGELKG